MCNNMMSSRGYQGKLCIQTDQDSALKSIVVLASNYHFTHIRSGWAFKPGLEWLYVSVLPTVHSATSSLSEQERIFQIDW